VNRTLTGSLLIISSVIGLVALLFPFIAPVLNGAIPYQSDIAAQPGSFSYGLLTVALIGISLLLLAFWWLSLRFCVLLRR